MQPLQNYVIVRAMTKTEPIANPVPRKKRGRPTLGNRAMSGRERMHRSRVRLAEAGGHYFAVRIEGMHWDHVEMFAQATEQEAKAVIKELFESILDRFVGLNNRAAEMEKAGMPPSAIADFYKQHFQPTLPEVSGERTKPTK